MSAADITQRRAAPRTQTTMINTQNLPSRAAVEAAWNDPKQAPAQSEWDVRCIMYFRFLPLRGPGGTLTEQDQAFLVEASEHLGCRIAEVVTKLRESSNRFESRLGERLLEWGIYS